MRFFEMILNAYYWLRIFVSPFSIGLLIGWITWCNIGGFYGQLVGILITSLGAILGIRFAENVRKKEGGAFVKIEDASKENDHD